MSRILKTGKNQVTQKYKKLTHKGIDIVKYKSKLDYIIAHTEGEVVEVVKNCNKTYKYGGSYGNYVRIKHPNGYYTLYAHMAYGSVKVSKGQKVKKGQVIGYMGMTGHSTAGHLHFEVRDTKNKKIDPTPYIDADLPNMKKTSTVSKPASTTSYYKKCAKKYVSLVDALNSIGVNSKFSNRSKIAKKNGIKLYIGSASQNTKLLNLLKQGKLKK